MEPDVDESKSLFCREIIHGLFIEVREGVDFRTLRPLTSHNVCRFYGVKLQMFRKARPLWLDFSFCFLISFPVRPTCVILFGRLHRISESRPGRYPRQPGQGGNAAAVTSFLSGQDPAFHLNKALRNLKKS